MSGFWMARMGVCMAVVGVACSPGPAQKGLLISDTARRDTGGTVGCDQVELSVSVEAVTIAGTPFGLTDADRETTGLARFAWLPCTEDRDDFPNYGRFPHSGQGTFSLALGELLIEGSGALVVETTVWEEDHHVRFIDGQRVGSTGDQPPPVMLVAGREDASVSLWSSFSVDSQLEPDVCPESVLLAADQPHTFSLDEGESTLLLQLTADR